MFIRSTRRPGQPGTKRLVAEYGDRLVCVRYRYDPVQGRRYKTIELIVSEGPWQPPDAYRPDDLVWVQIYFREGHLQTRARAVGGRWDPSLKLWRLRYCAVKALGLVDRIVAREEL